MFIAEMFTEAAQPQLVVIYPGRFQPFHLGHRDVFESLQAKYGRDNVYIATSNKTELPKSPFNFTDKTVLMHAAGVPNDRILEVKSPYILPPQFDPASTVFVVAVGAPDADRLKPGSYKKDGQPSYYQKFEDLSKCQTADKHGYVIIAAERKKVIIINGQQYDASHGTENRALWNSIRGDAKARGEYLLQMYGRNDPEVGRILDKIPMNEDSISPHATDSASAIPGISEHIVKHGSQYRLLSKHGNKNLGTFPTKAAAQKHEREVQYFKHAGESIEEVYDHNAPFNAADFNRHMEQLRAREELRKTDPMKALVGDLIDKEHEKERLAKRKPADDSSLDINDPRHPGWGALHGSLNEFAPDGFNGGDDGEEFNPKLAKMAQEEGFVKGVSLADAATLEMALKINHWDTHDSGIYKQYFAKGFKEGRMNKINHDNKQYNLNLKLMKDGSVRHSKMRGVAEDAAGVGVVSNSKDPRYVMATMGDQNDVDASTLPKMMKAYGLTRKLPKHKVKEAEQLLSRLTQLQEQLATLKARK